MLSKLTGKSLSFREAQTLLSASLLPEDSGSAERPLETSASSPDPRPGPAAVTPAGGAILGAGEGGRGPWTWAGVAPEADVEVEGESGSRNASGGAGSGDWDGAHPGTMLSAVWETEGLQTVGIVVIVCASLKLLHLLGLINFSEGKGRWGEERGGRRASSVKAGGPA